MQAIGSQFCRLTLLAILPKRSANKHVVGLWRCECGNEKQIAVSRVRNGYAKSCGCLSPEVSKIVNRTHGKRYSREYSSWQSMKGRCLNPDNKDYPRWGGKGVTIFSDWINSFEAFFAHVGPRPKGTSLDRIDNTKGYFPGNVRWVSATMQASNRMNGWTVEIDGKEYPSVQAAAEAHGVSDTTIARWCDGFSDPRRDRGRVPPTPNCRRWRTYAS